MENLNWHKITVSLAVLLVLAASNLLSRPGAATQTRATDLADIVVQTPASSEPVRLPLIMRNRPPSSPLVINEIMYWPAGGEAGQEWIEIYNASSQAVDLDGWTVSNEDGSSTVGLPAWNMPGGTFLVIHFGVGIDDADFSDGAGALYTGLIDTVLRNEQGAVALYRGAPSSASIRDFVAWSETGEYSGGSAYDHAVHVGMWQADTFFKSVALDSTALTRPVLRGESIGRDRFGTDTNTPQDWAPLGGRDALGVSPGAVNFHDWRLDFGDGTDTTVDVTTPRRPAIEPTPQPQPRKAWTVMVLMDPRDRDLRRNWINDINQMEQSGSDANVNIVVQIGSQAGHTYRFHITHDVNENDINSPQIIPPRSETVDPGNPDTLSDFISWTKTNFPANRYAIVLAGHGQGWKGTMIHDDDDHLTMAELSTGLAALGTKFEAVLFYSCLMGQTEVGYQIADQAKMMVASEEVTWTLFPWEDFIDDFKDNADWNAGQFADKAAQDFGDRLENRGIRSFTMASVDLSGLEGTLKPRVDSFATKLVNDIEDYKTHDTVDDNAQIRIKHEAQEEAEEFVDRNFKDLYHFAELVQPLPVTAAADAQPIMNALSEGGDVIRWEDHGSRRPDAHGLSIYFPHDLVYPDRGGGITRSSNHAFDNPTFGRHLYKRDANILLPRLRQVDHALADDPGFKFPNDTNWDEFLHRYYKPVADACIRQGEDCVSEVVVPVGTELTLSGNGSSDSDGPERDDVPAHDPGSTKHWYWDFDPQSDHPADIPDYQTGTRYRDCDDEDCDRDEDDDEDDDKDAQGRTVTYTCGSPGTFRIRLMVWDEHHDQRRRHVENREHNRGRHYLHFNVDDDWVTVTCVVPATPTPTPTIPPQNRPPYTPSDPSPTDGTSNVPCGTTTFTWAGGDPDPDDTVTYDVYSGPSPEAMTLVVADHTETSLEAVPEWRDEYWQVIAEDTQGASVAGPIWHFQTGPWIETLANGGFELETDAWEQTSLRELPLIWNVEGIAEFGDPHVPHSGQWFAWLGDYANAQDHLWQTFVLPTGTRVAESQVWWLMETEEQTTAAVDTLELTLTSADGDVLTTLGAVDNTSSPTNTWSRLAPHLRISGVSAGTEVQLHVRVAANEEALTDFHLDDVSFEVCSPGG